MDRIGPFSGQHRFLSNFWPVKIDFEGHIYPSVEHAYQAWKFPKELRWKFAAAKSPKAARGLARSLTGMRPEAYEEEQKLNVMRQLLQMKFQHVGLKHQLLATGTAELAEINVWGDMFWGLWGKPLQGKNHLGRLLMEIRDELRKEGN